MREGYVEGEEDVTEENDAARISFLFSQFLLILRYTGIGTEFWRTTRERHQQIKFGIRRIELSNFPRPYFLKTKPLSLVHGCEYHGR
jgi:hypothetical protein